MVLGPTFRKAAGMALGTFAIDMHLYPIYCTGMALGTFAIDMHLYPI